MKRIIYPSYIYPGESSDLSSLSQDDLFLDIETTGLSKHYNHIYLIGLGKYIPSSNQVHVWQYFAQTEDEEILILQEFQKELDQYKSIITFNGNRFDIPFIIERMKHYGLSTESLEKINKRDLYFDFKKAKQKFQLPSLKQKSIESFLGITRIDEMDGGSLIPVYKSYTKEFHSDSEKLLLLHNEDDVKGMFPLFQMYRYLNLTELKCNIRKIEIEGENQILFWGDINTSFPSEITYRSPQYLIRINENKIKGWIIPEKKDLYFELDNPSDYVYLLAENTILPKLLASTLPKERYRKAKKAECIQNISGYFIETDYKKADAKNISIRFYYSKYNENKVYFKMDPETVTPDLINEFINNYMKKILS